MGSCIGLHPHTKHLNFGTDKHSIPSDQRFIHTLYTTYEASKVTKIFYLDAICTLWPVIVSYVNVGMASKWG